MPVEIIGAVKRQYSVFASAHSGASTTSRELAMWQPLAGSADSDLLPDLGALVSRSRDIVRNNGTAAGAVETIIDNIVGTGLRLKSIPDWRSLGKSKEWAQEWSTQTESQWWLHADSHGLDVSRQLGFAGQTRQVLRASIVNGEGLALILWRPDPKYKYATTLQLIEADRLSNPQFEMDSKTMRGGVEIDAFGQPVAYHIQKSHPGDAYLTISHTDYEWERIPAETVWGRKRVLHVHDKERSGQSRGKPLFSPVLEKFRMLDNFQRFEVQSAIVNSMISAFIETPMNPEQVSQLFGGDVTSDEYQQWLLTKNEHVAQLKGAAVIPLQPGEKLAPFIPSRPNAAYAAFCDHIERQIGAGINLPRELLAKDFSKSNYSNTRAAMLEAFRFFTSRREWLSNYWCKPVYDLWLEEAVNKGEIEAPGFYENRYAYCRSKWLGPPRGYVDPVKEAQSVRERINSLVSTHEDEAAAQGYDFEELVEQQVAAYQLMEKSGLLEHMQKYSLATGKQPQPIAGEPQPPDTNEPEPEPVAETEEAYPA